MIREGSFLEDVLGEKALHLAFLGGTVTQACRCVACYGDLLVSALQAERRKELPLITWETIGIPGTGSPYGMFVLGELLKNKPRLVFLEYSMNDCKDMRHREALDGLIGRCLAAAALPVLVLPISEYGYSCRTQMVRMGEHYGIPIVDVGMQLQRRINDGLCQWQQYFSDYEHPNAWGHQYIADCCLEALKKYEMPDLAAMRTCTPCYAGTYRNFYSIPGRRLTEECRRMEVAFSGDEVAFAYARSRQADAGLLEVRLDGSFVAVLDTYDLMNPGSPGVAFFRTKSSESAMNADASSLHKLTLLYAKKKACGRERKKACTSVMVPYIGAKKPLQFTE